MDFSEESSADPFGAAEGGAAFDVKRLLATVRAYYWIVGVTVLLGFVGAKLYMLTMTEVFASSALIKIERRSTMQSVSAGEGAAYEGATTAEDLNTIVQSFVSPMIMQRVIERLGLNQRDDVIGKNRPASTVRDGELVGYLMGQCKVELVEDTRLIRVSFQSWNPEMAGELANAIVEEGIAFDREKRTESVSANVKFLQGEAEKQEANLKAAEEKLNAYTEEVGIVSVDDASNIVEVQLRDLNSRHTAIQTEYLKLKSDYDQIEACLGDTEKLLDIESIRKVPAVERLYLRAGELRGQLVKLAQRYRVENPLMVQTQTELREVEDSLRQEVLQAPKSIEMALAAARKNEESIAKAEAAQEQKMIEVQKLAITYKVYQRQIEAYRMAYEATLSRLNGELSEARIQPVLLQVVEPAGWGWQTSIKPLKVALMGIVAGGMLGMGLIFLIMQMDRSVKTVEEAETLFRLSVLSAIPRYLGDAGGKVVSAGFFHRMGNALRRRGQPTEAGADPALSRSPMITDRYSSVAEAFRTLRASIHISHSPAHCSMILITSAMPGEGKSFCVLNLGVAAAHSGQRTLLVDANLRNPSLEHRIFDQQRRSGLADYLTGRTEFFNVIQATSIANLDVVTAGTPHALPGEILAGARFHDFLKEAQPNYDRIIFDTAPIIPVSDTLSIARYFEVMCLVLQANKTPRDVVSRAMDVLGRAGAKPFGLVMNCVPFTFQATYGTSDVSRLFRSELAGNPGFPQSCPTCGSQFHDLDDFIKKTRVPTGTVEATVPASNGRTTRICACGYALTLSAEIRRDTSKAGVLRRYLFGELHDRLVESGFERGEARARLLLTLKVWRNETFEEEGASDTSEAGLHRRELFAQILDHLVQSGLSRAEAKSKLLRTIEAWRDVP